jgi:hypothetical protein
MQKLPQILGAIEVAQMQFQMRGPKILGATTKISFATATWPPSFVHPCITILTTQVCMSKHK